MSGQSIRSTKTYIWYLKDVLGTGATSSVYMGRHKKTGDVVAVKMFNHMSYMRPHDVQRREFEVLLKLDHKNIIHLDAIEDDQISKQPVIIMELCTGGSLYSHLELPENQFGLKEKDFLDVLQDVSAGMKHLRDKGIIHRDIKPGNIMMVRGDDGVTTFKLADFGAARELDDGEAFMSLYGTEEYLHPDLYERAVLGKKTQMQFTAQTDLWSLGVTFYHTATGSLPFKAYGGRSNREVMHKITTTKKSGMISGIQESPNGPIIWSEELPKKCHLSPQMRIIVTTLLANTMECDMSKMWSFERFFDEVQKVMKMRVIDVFIAHTCELHKIYVSPSKDTAYFQQQVAHLTGIQPDTQSLLWEMVVFDPRKCFKCEDLPETTPDNPMILLRIGAQAFPGIKAPHMPTLPKTATHYSLQHDYPLAKSCAAVMCYCQTMVMMFCTIQSLITKTAKAVIVVLRSDYFKLRSECSLLKVDFVQGNTKLQNIERFLFTLSLVARGNDPVRAKMERFEQLLAYCRERASNLNVTYNQIVASLDAIAKTAISDDYLSSQWEGIRQQHVLPTERIGRLKVLVEDALKICTNFKKDRQTKQLSYNEEQIHRMDKEKLGKKMIQAKKISDELFTILKELHNNFGTWHGVNSETRRFQEQLTSAEVKMKELPYEYKKLLSDLQRIEDDLQALVIHHFGGSAGAQVAGSFGQGPPKEVSNTADVTTSTTPSLVQKPVTSGQPALPPQSAASNQASLMLSVQQLISDLPYNSLGMVPVPRQVKQLLQQYEHSLTNLKQQLDMEPDISTAFKAGAQIGT
ncbi:serine/threonine-protein kinase TBK1-like isoform X1 [Diadema antillarum]|uniref:serine/threonine-protein kinase TBK1-like isoform X1 n=2 Tax=Diadema antillarum TaxID=105358 RepID=UPI003A8A535D